MPIRSTLSAQRFFVTGGTGFLGTALIERILRTLPEAEVVALVRPGRRASAAQRAAREILRNDCFDRLREETGDQFDQLVGGRLVAVAGDVGTDGLGLDDEGRAALAASDVVIHSAATVSFDAPLDQAVEVNLLGPSRVAAAVAEARAAGGRPAHLVAVSTAYVAGTHQGEAREELLSANRFTLDINWEAEVDYARRLRADLQAESRRPDRLAELAKEARRELGGAGEHLLAARVERNREDWVVRQLVRAGTARAQALGWPDAYPFTKAMGERALVARHGPGSAPADRAVPLTIVRPSIIESALAEPRPGWIRGFRMAEPIIVSFARGLLPEFPGVPEGVIDVIPIDLVVAAILAVAAHGPDPDGPTVYHVASGVANPLRYGELLDVGVDWLSKHPVYDDRGQPIKVSKWSLPGRGKVQRQLERADKAMAAVERLLTALPIRGRQAEFSARLEDRHTMVSRALSYVELYGAYTETEARYRVDRLLALWDQLDDEDHRDFCFDPGVIDWHRYVEDIHFPSVMTHARVRTTPTRSVVASRAERGRAAILSPERHLAAFDLEHTLLASNVVDAYAWLASRHLPANRRAALVADLVKDAPTLLRLDRRDRGDFLRTFYRRYEGAPVDRLAADAWELFHRQLLTRAYPAGFARVRHHRRLGHRTLLITGALDVVVAPLEPLFDDIVCAHLGVEDGRFTGRLEELPPTGEARALLLADYASDHGLSLDQSVAYADSSSDLAMLEAVGFPVAVNPEARLAAIARRRGWHVEHWEKAAGGSGARLPLGPFDRRRPASAAGGNALLAWASGAADPGSAGVGR
jgi:HAD superfamily hydrolase (TIGR01490 family)